VDSTPRTGTAELKTPRRRLAAEPGLRSLKDTAELSADVWDSEEELDEFLREVRRSWNASLAWAFRATWSSTLTRLRGSKRIGWPPISLPAI
jgi:hypothetical protein